ncbi:hypothetical protein C8Q73DRAFT_269943 [Cubamyces lactineus]|nr:hypothetical protein C8Q73DRAFT_269943 [Cubamyces lactineus]
MSRTARKSTVIRQLLRPLILVCLGYTLSIQYPRSPALLVLHGVRHTHVPLDHRLCCDTAWCDSIVVRRGRCARLDHDHGLTPTRMNGGRPFKVIFPHLPAHHVGWVRECSQASQRNLRCLFPLRPAVSVAIISSESTVAVHCILSRE